jgi:site-specific DNA-adenine methylase
MNYPGGKSKLARKFAPILEAELTLRDGILIEPFTGGFNIVPALGPALKYAVCSDLHPGLISLYEAVAEGWSPPEDLSEEEYQAVRAMQDWSLPLTAFIAFGCSFGAKEWGGYARNARGDNYCARASRSLLKKRASMERAEFLHRDYYCFGADVSGAVIYADPPYKNTLGYKTGAFDSARFYSWCEARAREDSVVFVSEFSVPERPNWEIVWYEDRAVTMDLNSSTRTIRRDLLIEVHP